MKIFALLFIVFCQTLLAGTPTEILNAFQKEAKAQNLAEASKHTAQFEGLDEKSTQYFQARVQKILELTAQGWALEPLEEKIIGDCAVVLCSEKKPAGRKQTFDPDPAYLIKQKGEWKILPTITSWNLQEKLRLPIGNQPDSIKLNAAQTAAYLELEKWVDERSEDLKMKGRPR